MSWIKQFFLSTLGRKLVMSLTGLFLILFLIVHLAGNFQLLIPDQGKSFNIYTYQMTHNIVIKIISYSLYAFILIHAVQGIMLALYNRKVRKKRYLKDTYPTASGVSKQMALLGLLVFAFLLLHMGDFWYKLKFTDAIRMASYAGFTHEVADLYPRVLTAFQEEWIVIAYLVGLVALAMHLWHGFESAFQTLGIRHMRFGYVIRPIGRVYSILIPLGFAIIPVYMYFIK